MTDLIEYYLTLDADEKKKLCKKYMRWLLDRPCCINGTEGIVRHHVKVVGWYGTALKPPDVFCVPIDGKEHNHLEHIHQNRYEKEKGICFIDILTGLHDLFSRLYDLQKIVEGEE